ncbi:MAG: TetR/AcrR family transcriptional regulator [Pacificimonas sp.]
MEIQLSKRIEKARARLDSAARTLFFQHGYAAVTTDMLAAEARISKATLYRLYANKAELFAGMIAREAAKFGAGLPENMESRADFRAALQTFGERFLALIDDPEKKRLEHLTIGHVRDHPDLGELFYANAHQATHHALTKVIAAGQRSSVAPEIWSAEIYAKHLLAMWIGIAHAATLFGLPRPENDTGPDWIAHCLNVLFGETISPENVT